MWLMEKSMLLRTWWVHTPDTQLHRGKGREGTKMGGKEKERERKSIKVKEALPNVKQHSRQHYQYLNIYNQKKKKIVLKPVTLWSHWTSFQHVLISYHPAEDGFLGWPVYDIITCVTMHNDITGIRYHLLPFLIVMTKHWIRKFGSPTFML